LVNYEVFEEKYVFKLQRKCENIIDFHYDELYVEKVELDFNDPKEVKENEIPLE